MMRKILLLLFVATAFILSSCTSTFYYPIIGTSDYNTEKIDNGDFLFENDSLWIAYCFMGEDAPIQITIFNKMEKPIYVNWGKSKFFLGKSSSTYRKAYVTFVGDQYGNDFEDKALLDKLLGNYRIQTKIPPAAMIRHMAYELPETRKLMKQGGYSTNSILTKNNKMSSVDSRYFSKENSPYVFSSYLAIHTSEDDTKLYGSSFFMEGLIKTKKGPNKMTDDMMARGDTFYLVKEPNNKFWEILGVSALVATGFVLDVMANDYDD